MNDTLIGLIVGIIVAVAAFLAGRGNEKRHTVVRDSDVLEGVIERRKKQEGLRKSTAQILHESKEETQKISKELKEAPNEEIVRRFHDAFRSDPVVRSRSTARRLRVQRGGSDQ